MFCEHAWLLQPSYLAWMHADTVAGPCIHCSANTKSRCCRSSCTWQCNPFQVLLPAWSSRHLTFAADACRHCGWALHMLQRRLQAVLWEQLQPFPACQVVLSAHSSASLRCRDLVEAFAYLCCSHLMFTTWTLMVQFGIAVQYRVVLMGV